MRPGATPRNPLQPITQFDKTNPIFSPDSTPAERRLAALDRAAGAVVKDIAPALRSACNGVQPGATPCNPVQPIREMCKTKPIPPDDGFDARQLAAARLLAMGRSVPDAARELKLSRSTVWRWQRQPAFRAELLRIHERMIAPRTITPGPRSVTPGPRR